MPRSPPAASSGGEEPPPPALKGQKRAAAPSKPAAKKTKRARFSVGADESTQVSSLGDKFRLPLADADCFYVPDLIDERTAQEWHDELLKLDEWYRPTLKVYGKDVVQSRKIAAFATDPGLEVKYSGHPVKMSYEYPPLLREIQDLIEARLGVTFNHVMGNLYEDGGVYIGKHRDNRENRVIASLSLGAPRTFILTHDRPPPSVDPASALQYTHRLQLASGSLLVMQGATQQRWKHEIPREKRAVRDCRISLTFRQLVF
ncbi:hypothetical protein JCM10449v2_008110 [Rhodotorula kratochvilovae]